MIISRTPLRTSFFGGGTDYPHWFEHHPGAVLATTVDKYIYVSCRYLPPFFEHNIRVAYSSMERTKSLDEIQHPAIRECLRFMGVEGNIEVHTDSDLPARTGLGSSSSFTVGLLHALSAYHGRLVTKSELAQKAIHVEQNLLRENVGCQDQVLAAFGGLNRIDFAPGSEPRVTPIPLARESVDNFERHLLLFFSGIARTASDVVAEQLSQIGQREKQLQRMYTLVDEGMKALCDGSLRQFGELLHENWMLKRTLSSQVTNGLIDKAYEAARERGAWGGKLLGAGGGGFLLIFAEPSRHRAVREALAPLLYVPVKLESLGSQIIFYSPNASPGASAAEL